MNPVANYEMVVSTSSPQPNETAAKPVLKLLILSVVTFILSLGSLAWISWIYLNPGHALLRGSPAVFSTTVPTTVSTTVPTVVTTVGPPADIPFTPKIEEYTANCTFAGPSAGSTFLTFSNTPSGVKSEDNLFDWVIYYQSDYEHGHYCSEFVGQSVNGVYPDIHQASYHDGQIMAVGTLDTSQSTTLKTDYFEVIPNEVWCAFLVEVTVNETSYRVYDIYSHGFQNCDPYPQSVYDTNGFTFEILAHADVKVISGQNTWMELIIGSMNIDPNVGQQLYIFFSREVGHSLVSSYKRVLSLL